MSGLFFREDNTVRLLRQMAREGRRVSELVEAVFQAFGLRPNDEGIYPHFAVWHCFKDAFDLTWDESMEIVGWEKFGHPGYTDEELEIRIMPLIQANEARWFQMKTTRSTRR